MRIIICGAGQIALGIAKQLSKEDNVTITIIDENRERLSHIAEHNDVRTVCGFPSYPNVLDEAGASEAEMILAITPSDETNLVICQMAASIFDIPIKIARIKNQQYSNSKNGDIVAVKDFPVDKIISPEMAVAKAIVERIKIAGSSDTIPVDGGSMMVIKIRCHDDNIVGKSLYNVTAELEKYTCDIIGLYRNDKFNLPNRHDVFQSGDEIFIIAKSNNIQPMLATLGHKEKTPENIKIIGGGNIGLFVAQILESDDNNISCTIIELDGERANNVADELKKTTIINGNALDSEILLEAGIEDADLVLNLTNDDKVNIFASLLIKKMVNVKTFCLLNHIQSYASMVKSLGVDEIIDPKEMTVSTILSYTRRGGIQNDRSICAGKAEIIEFVLNKDSSLSGKYLQELPLDEGAKIIMIVRDGEIIKASELISLKENDKLIIISDNQSVASVMKLSDGNHKYF